MIPHNAIADAVDIAEGVEQPTLTYYWDIEKDHIRGYTDGQLAMKQAIFKILTTERYKWVIYSWNYGVELADLKGQPVTYCVPEIKRRVTEALLYDDRIEAVDGWEFDLTVRDLVQCKFVARTIFGDVDIDGVEVPS